MEVVFLFRSEEQFKGRPIYNGFPPCLCVVPGQNNSVNNFFRQGGIPVIHVLDAKYLSGDLDYSIGRAPTKRD